MPSIETKFKKRNQKILDYIKSLDIDAYSLQDNHYKLPLSDAIFCIEDLKRNFHYYKAIRKSILDLKKPKSKNIIMKIFGTLFKKKIKVMDVGCGTGILGLYALMLGADKVVFIENNPYSLDVAKKMIGEFGFEKKSKFILGDATTMSLNGEYDIMISETLESTLGYEDFPLIIDNLKQYMKPSGVIVPGKVSLDIAETTVGGKVVETSKFEYDMFKGFKKNDIVMNDFEKNKLSFKLTLNLYKNIELKSGDCAGFINEYVFDHKNSKHYLFDIK